MSAQPQPQPQPSTAVVAQPRQQFDLSPQTFDQALTFCDYLADSDLVPKDFKGKPANCLIAIQWGAELGLKPLQALQNLAIINGRPALWGDAVLAIVRASPLCEYVKETDDGQKATCKVKRRGEDEEVRTFGMDDAKTAGLLGKAGPWTQYPKRMRQMRARAFALRDVFTDVLRGMAIAEEIMDIQAVEVDAVVLNGTVVNDKPALAGPTALPAYPDDKFAENLPKWWTQIAGGKSADHLISMLQTKATFTAEQLAEIRNVPTDSGIEDDDQQQDAQDQGEGT